MNVLADTFRLCLRRTDSDRRRSDTDDAVEQLVEILLAVAVGRC